MREGFPPSPVSSEVTAAPANSKLAPHLQELVRSPEFIEWFGDWQNNPHGPTTSKIIDDETGEPQIYYHGTNRQFDISQPRTTDGPARLSNFGLEHDHSGTYITDTDNFAKQYADPIGADFGSHVLNISSKYEVTTYQEVFGIWNDMLRACQQRSGRIQIQEDSRSLGIDEFSSALQQGVISYSSAFLFDGKPMGHVGEMLHIFGGDFPQQEDELVPYHSLYPATEERLDQLEASSGRMLMIKKATPRVIPVFVKSNTPLTLEALEGGRFGVDIDNTFSQGFDTIQSHPDAQYDAVAVKDSTGRIGTNIAILDPSQLREAPAA